MIGYNDFNIYSSGFHKPNIKNEVRFYSNKLKLLLINFSTEKMIYLLRYLNIIILKVSRGFPQKNDYKYEPQTYKHGYLKLKQKRFLLH
jgi:hypothetical protein